MCGRSSKSLDGTKMSEALDFIEIGTDEEIIQKTGTEQYVKLASPNTALYVSSAAAKCIPNILPRVLIGKAGKYLLFHFTDSKKGFAVSRYSGGFSIPMAGVVSKLGIRPEQVNGKRPKLIKDGFAVELY